MTRRLIALWDLPPPATGEAFTANGLIKSTSAASASSAIQLDGNRISTGSGKAQRKPRDLLFHLIIANGRDLEQGWLADELWPDADGDQSIHSPHHDNLPLAQADRRTGSHS